MNTTTTRRPPTIAVLTLAATLLVACSGSTRDSSRAERPSTSTAATDDTGDTSPSAAPGQDTADPGTGDASPATEPVGAADVGRQFVEGWIAGDDDLMAASGTPEAVEAAMAAEDSAGLDWAFSTCEGAAGTVYCTWGSAGSELVIGVGNIEQPRLVTSFTITP
jgi:hypothetical protein